jgi:acyl carrier protein
VRACLARQTGFKLDDISLELTLDRDLGLDSLDALELADVLEEETGVLLDIDSRIKSMRTVKDLVDWLMSPGDAQAGAEVMP